MQEGSRSKRTHTTFTDKQHAGKKYVGGREFSKGNIQRGVRKLNCCVE